MKKIIFIEDESALQRAASKILTEEGYHVFSALDGEAGIELVKKELPDLIILDLILPKKNGFKVMEELGQDPATKNIPIVILSNLEGGVEVSKAMELGAISYLVKTNYQLAEVVKKIKAVLDGQK